MYNIDICDSKPQNILCLNDRKNILRNDKKRPDLIDIRP